LGQALVEKIIAKASGRKLINPGEIVEVNVDRLLINDLLGPTVFKNYLSLNAKEIISPERIIFGADHRIPPAEVKLAENLNFSRKFCKDHKLSGFGEIGRHGIGHQLMCENFTRPGEIAVGTDSHATMYGGMGALGCAINSSDAAYIMATGKIWMRVPESCRITLKGNLKQGVTAKDIALKMQTLAPIEHFIYKAVEISGDGAHALSVEGRLVLANMAAEIGAKCAIIPPDEKISEYLKTDSIDSIDYILADEDVEYQDEYEIAVEDIKPLVACPHFMNNVKEVSEVRGVPIHQALLGSCTNGRIEDLQQAAEILKHNKVHADVRLIIIPASQNIYLEATRLGLTEIFLSAGAAIMLPSCAACAGNGPGVLASGERCISTTNRNWKGRMGSPDSEVFLASAYTVAASAVAGEIEDCSKYF
jgi:3-isopropylmalate/(R)-2-methylmalate dehydratase large subunit